MIARLRAFFDRLIELLIQGAIVRGEGDRDRFDIIDHKTGKPKQ